MVVVWINPSADLSCWPPTVAVSASASHLVFGIAYDSGLQISATEIGSSLLRGKKVRYSVLFVDTARKLDGTLPVLPTDPPGGNVLSRVIHRTVLDGGFAAC